MMVPNAQHAQWYDELCFCYLANHKSALHVQDNHVFYSVDGNFGLCRKKSAGNSVRPPLHDSTMFLPQEEVDQYVQSYGKIEAFLNKVYVVLMSGTTWITEGMCMQECNQFLASDVLRSKSRYKALDETGVVGVVCRHEFPFKMLSMRHGERY